MVLCLPLHPGLLDSPSILRAAPPPRPGFGYVRPLRLSRVSDPRRVRNTEPMIAGWTTRALVEADIAPIATAFADLGWPGKDEAQYRRYLAEQAVGARDVLVGEVDGRFAGYITVVWTSGYPPFRAAGIPEIQD